METVFDYHLCVLTYNSHNERTGIIVTNSSLCCRIFMSSFRLDNKNKDIIKSY